MPGRVLPRDPLRTYTFRLRFDGDSTDLAGVRKVSGLSMAVASFEIAEGGNPMHRYQLPDKASWEPITLEQGLALDDRLERWARAGIDFLQTGAAPKEPLKRNLRIEVWEPRLHGFEEPKDPPAGWDPRRRCYLVVNAWVSRFQALPALDALTDEVAILNVQITHEGWSLAEDRPAQ